MEWTQTYDPLHSEWLSTLLAGVPIALLLGLLVAGASASRAALAGLLAALGVAVLGYGMPIPAALAAAGLGACFGLVPIGWIVFSAVFLFHLSVRAGKFEIVKRSVAEISPDRRIQALLIAFSFGAFVEGAAGFGAPVAISAALLIGLGFTPLFAASLALIANTSPVAFGALGTPILTLGKISGIDPHVLSQMAGRQLPFLSLIIPAWLVWTMSGWTGVVGCWPAVLVCGGSFAVLQFLVSNFHGPELVDVAGGLGSLACLTIFLRYWKPREIWRFPEERDAPTPAAEPPLTRGQIVDAWIPWALLSASVFVWGLPGVKGRLNEVGKASWEAPYLHKVVYRTKPVVELLEGAERAAEAEAAVYELPWLSATGTAIFASAALSALWMGMTPAAFAAQLSETMARLRWPLFTIACMLALGFTTRYSGADVTLGLAFTRTGAMYPFFAPLLGWLGVALTGSDTSSNVLFGSLQRVTAEQLGLNPVLIVASNSTGGVMGKMIDAQSIVVAAVATEQPGHEGAILRIVFPHSLALACLVGVLTLLQSGVLAWMTP